MSKQKANLTRKEIATTWDNSLAIIAAEEKEGWEIASIADRDGQRVLTFTKLDNGVNL